MYGEKRPEVGGILERMDQTEGESQGYDSRQYVFMYVDIQARSTKLKVDLHTSTCIHVHSDTGERQSYYTNQVPRQ